MFSKTVTIRDVAERAGVSQSTVSRVLNSSEMRIPISQDTRQRVQRVAEELGYRPHPGARSLSGRGTGLLGLIMREINDPFFAELIEVVSNVAKEEGYDSRPFATAPDRARAGCTRILRRARHFPGNLM